VKGGKSLIEDALSRIDIGEAPIRLAFTTLVVMEPDGCPHLWPVRLERMRIADPRRAPHPEKAVA
jgi:hypothetical protein